MTAPQSGASGPLARRSFQESSQVWEISGGAVWSGQNYNAPRAFMGVACGNVSLLNLMYRQA